MDDLDKLGFLVLVVALSAYLASVRLAVIARLGNNPKPDHPLRLKWFLVLLIPADAPLVVAGLLLIADLFSEDLRGAAPPSCFYSTAKWLFVISAVVLALHHLVGWCISVCKLCSHYKFPSCPCKTTGGTSMNQRLDYKTASPEAFRAMLHTEQQVHKGGIEESLLELVKSCASILNGCAWCLDMHTKDARAQGETEQRLYLLPVWREATCYTGRERAALAWTEAVTLIADTHDVPDAVYEEARRHFDEQALVNLTLAIIAINGWNRMNVAFRTKVGDYVSPHAKKP